MTADAIIVATGSINAQPPIPGLKENPNCIDSTGALSLEKLPATMVVIGGGVSKAGSVLLDGIKPYFMKYVFHAASDVTFALASLGNDAGAYGAFKLAVDAFAK